MRLLLLVRVLVVTALLAPAGLWAQDFQIPPVGSDQTLNVATWNIEHFGVDGAGPADTELQFANVLSIMQQANVHLWALQELNSQFTFNQLVAALGEGWAGIWQGDVVSGSIGYGYIYRTDRVQPVQSTTILQESAYDFAYRPPILLRANVTLPGGSVSNVRFINLHAKANTGSAADRLESYHRRTRASAALKNYVDNLVAANFPVLVLGDLNDEMRSSIYQSFPSPYRIFLDDNDRYHIGTLSLEDAGVNTFCFNTSCTSGSTIDHVLITSPLFDAYETNSTARYDALLTNIPSYRTTTSDHVAVYSRFDFFNTTSIEGGAAASEFALEAPYPNPFTSEAAVSYTLSERATVRLEVFDALGRRVMLLHEGSRGPGRHEATLSGRSLTPGLYLVRLAASDSGGERTATRRVVRLP
jgi:exonuclease III